MTQDEIISMAREAGLEGELNADTPVFLERFAALVSAHEREACANVCEEREFDPYVEQQCAAAIRNRDEK